MTGYKKLNSHMIESKKLLKIFVKGLNIELILKKYSNIIITIIIKHFIITITDFNRPIMIPIMIKLSIFIKIAHNLIVIIIIATTCQNIYLKI